MQTTRIMFVRKNKNHQPRGVLVAGRNSDGKLCIGWSYTNTKAGDRFKKARGIAIATARIEVGTDQVIPHEVLRCARRFRDEVLARDYDAAKESVVLVGQGPNLDSNVYTAEVVDYDLHVSTHHD